MIHVVIQCRERKKEKKKKSQKKWWVQTTEGGTIDYVMLTTDQIMSHRVTEQTMNLAYICIKIFCLRRWRRGPPSLPSFPYPPDTRDFCNLCCMCKLHWFHFKCPTRLINNFFNFFYLMDTHSHFLLFFS